MAEYVKLSDAEVTATVESEVCCVCGLAKRAGQPFCTTDQLALPLWQRNWLSRTSAPGYFDIFRSAANHLRGHSTRRLLIDSNGSSSNWPYTNLREVADGGYELVGEPTRCRAPQCGQQVLFVRANEVSTAFPINRADARPHRLTCADPDFFRRRREERERRALKTSAARKRRASR